jgi:DNA topoisomerase-1
MAARLVYSDNSEPGITRRKVRHGWGYWDAAGAQVTDRAEIDRLNAIGLPPAYRDAWFNPKPNGHIQAVGWDDRGRKQYRYHPDFRERREAEKYDGCAGFGRKLPALRTRVAADLRRHGLCREKAVAAVVRLLDLGQIRVGNEGYARTNKSFGATTLRKRHGSVSGATLKLQFRAKSGTMRALTLTDRSLARFVKRCDDLPGQHLFAWLDQDGAAHAVSSSDVNDYIREAMDADFTAKHFRTWGASVIAFTALAGAEDDIGLKAMLAPVTEALGNTPAIARKSYVHPLLIDLAKSGDQAALRTRPLPRAARNLSRAERGLIALLESGAATVHKRAA